MTLLWMSFCNKIIKQKQNFIDNQIQEIPACRWTAKKDAKMLAITHHRCESTIDNKFCQIIALNITTKTIRYYCKS